MSFLLETIESPKIGYEKGAKCPVWCAAPEVCCANASESAQRGSKIRKSLKKDEAEKANDADRHGETETETHRRIDTQTYTYDPVWSFSSALFLFPSPSSLRVWCRVWGLGSQAGVSG